MHVSLYWSGLNLTSRWTGITWAIEQTTLERILLRKGFTPFEVDYYRESLLHVAEDTWPVREAYGLATSYALIWPSAMFLLSIPVAFMFRERVADTDEIID